MSSDALDRYAAEADGISTELRTYLKVFEYKAIERMVIVPGVFEKFHNPDADILKRSLNMVGKAPGQIRKSVETLWNKDPEKLAQVMITAAALAEMACTSIRGERGNSFLIGMGYRAATKTLATQLARRNDDLYAQIGRELRSFMSSEAYQNSEKNSKAPLYPEDKPEAELSQQEIWKINGAVDTIVEYIEHLDHEEYYASHPNFREEYSDEHRKRIADKKQRAQNSLKNFKSLYPNHLQPESDDPEGP